MLSGYRELEADTSKAPILLSCETSAEQDGGARKYIDLRNEATNLSPGCFLSSCCKQSAAVVEFRCPVVMLSPELSVTLFPELSVTLSPRK
jgi:hypothetical protein